MRSVSHLFPQLTLQSRGAFRVRVTASNHKIAYVAQVKDILNLKENLNRMINSKVTTILLEGWILSIGGVASGRVCAYSLRSRLVSFKIKTKNKSRDIHLSIKHEYICVDALKNDVEVQDQ